MNKQSREALDAYYAEAEGWSRDRQEALRASRRTAWLVAGAAATIALIEAFALMLLTPLKTVVPYTLLVDRNTGFVQALKPLDPDKVAPDAALTQSFLVQYVIARESFDIDTLDANYRKVALWSAESARGDYVANVQISSPASPLALYPRTTVIETRVKSVSPVGRNAALVRFDTVRRDAGGQVQPPRSWVAVIRYRFSGEPMRLEDRFVNPLGFQVLRYRRDAEALAPEPVAGAPLPAQTGFAVPGAVPGAFPGAAGTSVTVVTPSTATTTVTGPAPLAAAAAAAARAAAARARARANPPPL
jgi:type IV secretion system protein VirB8